MGKRVFVSYSRKQEEWVHARLYPVLKAGGADVLMDVHRFQAGLGVYGQMDATQDLAEIHLLVLSPDYLASEPCVHEMRRAVAGTPGNVLPVVREDCTLPPEVQGSDPLLYVKLMDDGRADQWDLVTARCEVDLGVSAAEWLRVREQVRDALSDGRSVNLVIQGPADSRGLMSQIRDDLGAMAVIDLAAGVMAGRQGLIREILREIGINGEVRKPPDDLGDLHRGIMAAPACVRLAFRHFDLMKTRWRNYKEDFFSALKFLVEERKLTLLIASRAPYASLLPISNSLSKIQMKTVELRGRVQ